MLELFGRMKVVDDKISDWFRAVQRSQSKDQQSESVDQHHELTHQHPLIMNQQIRVLAISISLPQPACIPQRQCPQNKGTHR